MKRKLFHATIVVFIALIGLVIGVSLRWPVINDVQTGKTPEYPSILPQYYSADPQRVFDEARGSAGSLKNWKLVTDDRTNLTIHAERTTRVFGFVDDIDIKVEPVTEFATRVDVRSHSRVGKGDFGQNARNIQEFFSELDQRLGAVKFDPQAKQP